MTYSFNRFDEASKTAFVGDYSGTITILKLENTECKFVTALKGHMGKFLLHVVNEDYRGVITY